MAGTNGNGSSNGNGAPKVGTDRVKQGLAQMLKGGVIVSGLIPAIVSSWTLRASTFGGADVICGIFYGKLFES